MSRTIPLYKMLAKVLSTETDSEISTKCKVDTLASLKPFLPDGWNVSEYITDFGEESIVFTKPSQKYGELTFNITPSLATDFEISTIYPYTPSYHEKEMLRTALYTPIPYGDD